MSDDESTAEKIHEAGMELINPGGSPEDLRTAAKGWRLLHENLEDMFKDMDREVQRVLDESWKGEAADAFSTHWNGLAKGVEETLPQLIEAANSLDEAADSIEQINEEIHQIYLEIGISVGISVGLSFLTMGFSAAAGAARAAQLATRAAQLAGRLGGILRKIGTAFRAVAQLAGKHQFLKNVAVNWASNTGSTVISKTFTGQEVDLAEATWQGGLASVAGTGPALGVASKVGGKFGPITGEMAGGATGNVAGGFAIDGVQAARGQGPSGAEFGVNVAANVVGGAAGGAATHGANTQMPEGRQSPHLSVEGPLNGISYGAANTGGEAIKQAMDEPEDKAPVTVQDKMKEDFG